MSRLVERLATSPPAVGPPPPPTTAAASSSTPTTAASSAAAKGIEGARVGWNVRPHGPGCHDFECSDVRRTAAAVTAESPDRRFDQEKTGRSTRSDDTR